MPRNTCHGRLGGCRNGRRPYLSRREVPMLHDVTVPQFTKMLHNLSGLFDKATAHAEAKKFDVDILLNARLAPDQFPLIRQVQIACDTAKLGVSRLTGKDAPVHEDNEKTVAEAKARIESVIGWLSTVAASDFADAARRRITQPRWNGKWMSGEEYALQHVIPNFYFHVTTVYAILRHNGVDVGKKDYLGAMPFREPTA
jgi:hypothetical protein